MIRKLLVCVSLGMCLTISVFAQKHENTHLKGHEFKNLRLGLVIGHTYVPTETTRGTETVILPSIGLDIEYWFTHKWAIGLHNDIELESFEAEKEKGTIIQREFPVVLTLDGIWKPWHDLVLLAGPGVELETNESFFVFRIGAEYEVEFNKHWDITPAFFYDNRKDAFNTWSFGLGIGRRF